MENGLLLSSAQFREVSDYLADGWSWGALAGLIRHKWDLPLTAAELQSAYRAAQSRYAQGEKQRRESAYYAAALEE